MNLNIFGTTCFILILSTAHSENPECVSDVQGCAITFQVGVSQIGANNNTATCLKVNEFLECLNRVLQPCDLATRTSLLDAMNNLIDSYKRPPYNCVLSFADNFTVPECTLQIGSCAAWDLQAEASSPADACRYHAVYVTCMNDNTTSCNSTDRVEINQALSNSTNKFSPCPYNCYRRFDCDTTTLPTTIVSSQPHTTTVDYVTDQNTDTPSNATEWNMNNTTDSWNDYNETDSWNSTTRRTILDNNGTDDRYNMTTESSVFYNNLTTVADNVTTPRAVFDNNRTTTESDYQPYNYTSHEAQSNTTTTTAEIPIAETSKQSEVPSSATTLKADAETPTTPTSSGEPSAVSSGTDKPSGTGVTVGTDQVPDVTESDYSEKTTTVDYDSLGNNKASILTISGLLMAMVILISSLLN